MQSMLFQREKKRQNKEFDDATSYNVSHMTEDFDFKSNNETANLNDMSGFSSHHGRSSIGKSTTSPLEGTYSAI